MNTDTHKQKLEEEKALLEKELGTVAVENPEATGGFAAKEDNADNEPSSLDPVEIGTELESLTRNEAISDTLEQRYKNVCDALEKIGRNDGSYGICEVSGEEIESDRLEANPAARTNKANMG